MTPRFDGSPGQWDDDEDGVIVGDETDSGLDAVATYTTSFQDSDGVDGSDMWAAAEPLDDDPMVDTLTVTATNPARNVSATALLDGRVLEVRLEPNVSAMSESELAEQIAIVARLANRQGAAARHAFTAMFMQQLGHDPSATRSFLERDLGLPSPETVTYEKAAAFGAVSADDE